MQNFPFARFTDGFQQTASTKKVGVTGRYGVRYGASLRKQIKKAEIAQHAKYTCTFCAKNTVKRTSDSRCCGYAVDSAEIARDC
ncbi:Ribosomal protein L37ae [Niveomyces insectorum RCEF 264]|uniref:Ribosomal protein L37ae n=1 Tax=Niveomyces insectorum RCEF 264 TaxID=1081102 RepID=A0A167MAJ4_9HYPO|nr:Ribosomal protein L37ae [Niveomyces insectorum RCEF 264]